MMGTNNSFYDILPCDRARFFLSDLHVHSPASIDVTEGSRLTDLSEFERTRIQTIN